MGKRAREARQATVRVLREARLTAEERERMRSQTRYEGSPYHKASPGDFGLTPPSAPRPDKTLCDEARVFRRDEADRLFARAIEVGLVSEATTPDGFPKQLWVVDAQGRVFEAMYGGSRAGRYHGYPIRRSDPLHRQVLEAWGGG